MKKISGECKLISCATLCGAGGGGFLLALTKKNKSVADARKCLEDNAILPVETYIWYDCENRWNNHLLRGNI